MCWWWKLGTAYQIFAHSYFCASVCVQDKDNCTFFWLKFPDLCLLSDWFTQDKWSLYTSQRWVSSSGVCRYNATKLQAYYIHVIQVHSLFWPLLQSHVVGLVSRKLIINKSHDHNMAVGWTSARISVTCLKALDVSIGSVSSCVKRM